MSLTLVHVNFNELTMAALQVACAVTGDSETDILNRAVQFYGKLCAELVSANERDGIIITRSSVMPSTLIRHIPLTDEGRVRHTDVTSRQPPSRGDRHG